MWLGKSGLKAICQKLGLAEGVDVEFHNAKLLMTFSNGSTIQLAGASTVDEIEKFRGSEYDEVWIDEAKSYSPKLFAELVDQALEPALITRDGVLGMIGTPGNILDGRFFEVTKPGSAESVLFDTPEAARERERKHKALWASAAAREAMSPEEEIPDLWSFHCWTMRDNTAEPEQWARALRMKARAGYSDRNPIWRREYLGEWAADDTDSVYKFRRYTEDGEPWNIWFPADPTPANPFGLPARNRPWQYVYGMDLGAADPFALVILAYTDEGPELFQIYEYTAPKKSYFTSSQIGELLGGLIQKTGHPNAIVSDHSHLGASILQEIADRFGIVIEGAARGANEKLDAIELTNGDLIDGRLKLFEREGVKNHLAEEFLNLQWDETGVKENKKYPNHLADACIYARTKCQHHLAPEPEPEPVPVGSPEFWAAKARDEEERAAEPEPDAGVGLHGRSLANFMRGGRWNRRWTRD